MALFNSFLRRILGPMSFPRFPVAPSQEVSQTYQPTAQVKTNSVPPVPPSVPPV